MNRGPKPKTSKNSPTRPIEPLDVSQFVPTSALDVIGLQEFHRLVRELDRRNMLDRIDLGVVTAAGRAKSMIEKLGEDLKLPLPPRNAMAQLAVWENVYLRALRSLSLTLMPSRSLVKTTAKHEPDDGLNLVRYPA